MLIFSFLFLLTLVMVEDHKVPGLPTQGSSGRLQTQDIDRDHTAVLNTLTTQVRAEIEKEGGMGVTPYLRGKQDSGRSLVSLFTSLFHVGGRLHKVVID